MPSRGFRAGRPARWGAALALAGLLLTGCVACQPGEVRRGQQGKFAVEAVDSRPTLPPTHLGKGGAVMLGRTEALGAWEIAVVKTDLEPRRDRADTGAALSAEERRREQPFLVELRVTRTGDRPARLRDTLTFGTFARDGSRFEERTTIGKCADRVGSTTRANPTVAGGETLDVVTCFFVKLAHWDGVFLAVWDAESGDARAFHLQATSH
ncbi:MAG: hypothetical protein ACRDUY_16975 [Nitriliruptorales bacterium]